MGRGTGQAHAALGAARRTRLAARRDFESRYLLFIDDQLAAGHFDDVLAHLRRIDLGLGVPGRQVAAAQRCAAIIDELAAREPGDRHDGVRRVGVTNLAAWLDARLNQTATDDCALAELRAAARLLWENAQRNAHHMDSGHVASL